MPKPIKAIRYVHTSDIDPAVTKAGGDVWEVLVNKCVAAAQDALDVPPAGYTPTQTNSLTDLFTSLRATHRAIRLLVRLGDTKPESVDSLVLARLQLEALYNVCLLIETPEYVDRFVREAWKRQYVQYLLYREETKALPRFAHSWDDEHARLLMLARIWNVTDEQRLTLEHRELGNTLPPGVQPQDIDDFPTPGRLIRLIPNGPKKTMLERLYPEYQELCAYAHGRPIAGFGKTVFDDRSPIRKEMGEARFGRPSNSASRRGHRCIACSPSRSLPPNSCRCTRTTLNLHGRPERLGTRSMTHTWWPVRFGISGRARCSESWVRCQTRSQRAEAQWSPTEIGRHEPDCFQLIVRCC